MGKSVFVMDTPEYCGECKMSGTSVCRKWSFKETKTFPKDCPLTELPEKKLLHTQHMDYVEGFNDCLDAILSGGTENAENS